MSDAQFEQGLDQYVEELIKDHNVAPEDGNDKGLREAIKNKLVEEIELEILDRVSEEKSKEIDEKLAKEELSQEELKEIIESENIDYDDVMKTVLNRFEAAFSKMVEEKGAKNE